MPQLDTLHINALLADFSVGPRSPGGYIARAIAPVHRVNKLTDRILFIDSTAEVLRVKSLKRAPGSPAQRFDFKIDTALTYLCEGYGAGASVTDEEYHNADTPIQPYLDKRQFVMDQLDLDNEVRFVAALDAGLTGANTSTPDAKFDNYETSDPYKFIDDIINNVEIAGGARPNRLAMDRIVLSKLANHPDMIERIKYANGGVMGAVNQQASLIAGIFGIEGIDVADNVLKNTAGEGEAPVYSKVWGDRILVYHRDMPRTGTRGLAFHFIPNKILEGGVLIGENGYTFDSKRVEFGKRTDIQALWYVDQILVRGTNATLGCAGHLITNTLDII